MPEKKPPLEGHHPSSKDYQRAEFDLPLEDFPGGRFTDMRELEPPREEDLRQLVALIEKLATDDARLVDDEYSGGHPFWYRHSELQPAIRKSGVPKRWIDIYKASHKTQETRPNDPRYTVRQTVLREGAKEPIGKTFAIYDSGEKLSIDFVPSTDVLTKISIELAMFVKLLQKRSDAFVIEDEEGAAAGGIPIVKHQEERAIARRESRREHLVSVLEVQQLIDDLQRLVQKLEKEKNKPQE